MCNANAAEEADAGVAAGETIRQFAASSARAEIHISTGSEMLNQFQPDFFAQAQMLKARQGHSVESWK